MDDQDLWLEMVYFVRSELTDSELFMVKINN